jgi:hypothetical protein
MRLFVRQLVWLLLILVSVQPAAAAFEDAKAWFETLGPDARAEAQNDLLLVGKYDFLVDAQFGRATFDALVGFQHDQGRPTTGVLTPAERETLAGLAAGVSKRLGIADVSDDVAGVDLRLPLALLTRRETTDVGMSFSSADGEFSIETMHASLAGQAFADLYAAVLKPDPDRRVRYQNYSPSRFVVSGTLGAYSFYTFFMTAGDQAVGFSLAWGKSYDADGQLMATYLASHFVPKGLTESGDDGRVAAAALSDQSGAFRLPPDEPDLIVLNADITNTTPSEFDRALEVRPRARTLVLNSPGGDVDSALAMAREVHRLGLTTYVPDRMGCYSACAYVFFAGRDRWAAGELGVHQIYTEVADLVLAQTTLGDVIDALVDFGVHQPVISHMLRTPPDDMYVFSARELTDYAINHGPQIKRPVAVEPVVAELRPFGAAAYVQLASLETADAAMRSVGYATDRWASLFNGVRPEVEAVGKIYRVRLPASSVELATSICAAIQADGGGCYVTSDGT